MRVRAANRRLAHSTHTPMCRDTSAAAPGRPLEVTSHTCGPHHQDAAQSHQHTAAPCISPTPSPKQPNMHCWYAVHGTGMHVCMQLNAEGVLTADMYQCAKTLTRVHSSTRRTFSKNTWCPCNQHIATSHWHTATLTYHPTPLPVPPPHPPG